MSRMHSKEVAELAGVSVRTLRHYHQVGILPEPARGSNGYRHYALVHVAVLLRIRRLVDLGVALDRMPALLADVDPSDPSDPSAAEVLGELDRELQAEVERLQEQRSRIAGLLADGRRPDLPPGPSLADLVATISPDIAGLERDAGVVLASLGSESYVEDLRRLDEAVTRADQEGGLSAVVVRFRDLDPAAPESEVEALATDFADLLRAPMRDLRTSGTGRRLAHVRPGQLPTLDDDPRLNPAQLRSLTILSDRLESDDDTWDTGDV